MVFEETLGMNFEGSVYHPNFMDFNAFIEVGSDQHKEKSEAIADDDKLRSNYLSRYHFSSTFLREKPYNLTLFADKEEIVQNRDFFEHQTINKTEYGMSTVVRKEFLPLNVRYKHLQENTDRALRPEQDYREDLLSVKLDPEVKYLGKIRMDYTWNDFLREESGIPDQAGTTNNFNFSNRFSFDESKTKNLDSHFNIYALEGSSYTRNMNWNESLSLEHNEDLKTSYKYNFSDRISGEVNSIQHVVRTGVQHTLFESLVSSFDLEGTSLDSSNFEETIYGASLKEDYRKKLFPGILLNISGSTNYDIKKRDTVTTSLNIIDESVVLTDGTPTFLSEERVDISTIVVTNTAGTVTYTLDTDYQVISSSRNRIEIRRIGAGAIVNGSAVSVDYISTDNPSFDFATLQNNMRLGLSFFDEKIRVYYDWRDQSYHDISGEENLVLEKIDDRILGGEVRWGIISLGGEYEDYDSNITPYKALRLHEDINWNLGQGMNFTLRSRQDYVSLVAGERETRDLRGIFTMRFSPQSVGLAESGYRWQEGEGIDLESFTTRLTYRIFIGALFFEVGYEYEDEKSLNDRLENHHLFTKMKREF